MPEIRTQHLFTLDLTVATPLRMLGATPFGERRIAEVTGGRFEGARLRGTVLPGGGDWLLLRADGALQLDVRLILECHDGALIYMTYRGIRHGPAEVMARLNRGEAVAPSDYYFRAAPFFETGAEAYAWLNRIIAVASGHRKAEGPVYEVFELL